MTAFTSDQVDALLKACIEFRNDHGTHFAVGEIAGRTGVSAELNSTKELMDWLVETDSTLLAFTGLGSDNVPYYRLGRNALQTVESGGFKQYLRRKSWRAFISQASVWLPVVASIAAVVVSVLAWQAPKDDEKAMADLNAKIGSLEASVAHQKSLDDSTGKAIKDLRKDVDRLTQAAQARPTPKRN